MQKMLTSSTIYMLIEVDSVGIVSIHKNVISLYFPKKQNQGYGTRLIQYAFKQCTEKPTLLILENNVGAERLYRRVGFRPSGRINNVSGKFKEIEFILNDHPG